MSLYVCVDWTGNIGGTEGRASGRFAHYKGVRMIPARINFISRALQLCYMHVHVDIHACNM